MKKTITVILAVAVSTLLAYDTARFGGYTGGGASKPKYGAAAARASVKNPIRAVVTPEQFEKVALEAVVKDQNERAFYEEYSDGFRRGTRGISYVRVQQRISKGFFLCTHGDDFIALDTPGDDSLLDDREYTLQAHETGKVYDYITVLGAMKRVPVYEIPEPIEAADVMARFRRGEVFTLPLEAPFEEECQACGGTGWQLTQMGGKNSGTRNTICKTCGAKKTVKGKVSQLHSVSCLPAYIEKEQPGTPASTNTTASATSR